jgi:hypothetical protein
VTPTLYRWSLRTPRVCDSDARFIEDQRAAKNASYYLATDAEVILVRVLHGARDAAAIAERGGLHDRRLCPRFNGRTDS